ncbi:hypothetical protein [Trichloromonas sp.]|jgi:hypothetical protein|uniref:hypothetical protein n=1 Tax=Trichloromonas sp. TaxID=3069249 RepID=UPI002A48A9BC|nr:hypothetical protein [Trichloromonas sp.]
MQSFKNIYKIKLKIEFLTNYSIKITLIGLDDRFISKNNDTLAYSSSLNNFYIYSRNSFWLGVNSIRLPSESNYRPNENYSIRRFFNDKERYDYLYKLKKSLLEWSQDYSRFKNSVKSEIIYEGDTWTIK